MTQQRIDELREQARNDRVKATELVSQAAYLLKNAAACEQAADELALTAPEDR